ncbi:MAG: hypothetical protein KKA54_12865 [Proteobacteria bacterium]|nr:hypothetical protein [Pseudomonadota bacterium]MBU0967258.1 hypothetical protein [Pseudomonadota bacterium]
MKLILLAPPGAGNDTATKMLSKINDSVLISTGNILRGAVQTGTSGDLAAHGTKKEIGI